MRLSKESVKDIVELLKDYNIFATEDIIYEYCNPEVPEFPSVHIYGKYEDGKLVSVMTATFCIVFPHEDSPSGRIVQISGAYTKDEYRHRGFASMLLNEIQEESELYFNADYLCCDSSADDLYLSNGFEISSETRLWKRVNRGL